MNIPYVYRLTDRLTGKWYIGSSYRNGCNSKKLGSIYFSSSKIVKRLYSSDPGRFDKEILLYGARDYVIEMETRILKHLDAKNDPKSYNMHNNDCQGNYSTLNRSKIASLANESNKLNKTAVYEEGFYTSEKFLEGARQGGNIASDYMQKQQIGIFKPGYYESEEFLAKCSEVGKRNAINKLGVTGRSIEKMIEDNTKASYVLWECEICKKRMNSGNIVKHQKASGHTGKIKIKN